MKNNLTEKQIFNRIFKDLSGFDIPKNEEALIKQSKGSPVYGEINFTATKKLLDYLKLKRDDCFYDLGSGVGKMVLQTLMHTKVKKAVGIELSKERSDCSKIALKRSLEWFPDFKTRASFLNKDLMNVNLKDATVIYTCSTAFSIKFMKEIINKLSTIKGPLKVVSLQDFPKNNHFELVDILKLDMSWIKKTPVHVYKKIS